ncbi:MAG: hypothetical protein JXA25_15665 [Anaerolineales bacterium]|nr:hypothetical protein [Anaerolineales bacterium]
MLDNKNRYLQIAFNYDLSMTLRILSSIPSHPRIFIEAGTPFIKREGMGGIEAIRSRWSGFIVADLKTTDGAVDEVQMVRTAGASAATALGNSSKETLDLFIETCANLGIVSMIDMLSVDDPLTSLRQLNKPSDVIVLHRGRDEESTFGKVIQYKHVNRIRSKYPTLISAAGGVTVREARSAVFNGANIVVANLVEPGDPWAGISTTSDVREMVEKFLTTIA